MAVSYTISKEIVSLLLEVFEVDCLSFLRICFPPKVEKFLPLDLGWVLEYRGSTM